MRVLASRLPAFFGKPFVPLAAHTAHANANPAKNPPLDETTAAILRRRLDLEELEHLHKAVTSNLEHQAAACTVQAPQQVQVPNAAKQGFDGELCLYSMMFGDKAWQAMVLPDFLESVTGAPVKVVFVGDTPPARDASSLFGGSGRLAYCAWDAYLWVAHGGVQRLQLCHSNRSRAPRLPSSAHD